MSAYANYIKDFPARCMKLLDLSLLAEQKDLEVTLLIAVAGQAVMMPLERLGILGPASPTQRTEASHPSGDARTFKRAADKLSKTLAKTCKESPLFQSDLDAWKYKECELSDVNLETVEPMKSIEGKTCRTVLKILRNALAHGNLRTDGNPINRLVFLSRVSIGVDKYHRIECHPDVLRRFLHTWAATLKSLKLDPDLVIESPWFGSPQFVLDAVA